MTSSRHRALLWTPRVLALLMCVYLAVFSLDAFGNGAGVARSLVAFGVHLIPVLILLIVVAIAWRREWVGALVFACCALAYAFMARAHLSWIALISGPLLLVAIAYLMSWTHHEELHGAT